MISFASEEVRVSFHLLSKSKQQEYIDMADRLDEKGMNLVIQDVEFIDAKTSEVSIRVDKKL